MTNPDDDRTKTKQDWSIALAHRQRQLMNTCKERDEALDQVKALQDEVNRLEAELQTERHKQSCTSLGPAYMADGKDVFWTEKGRTSDSLPGMHHIIFESGREAQDGVQILNRLVKQRDQARARVAELEGDKRDAAHFQECLKAEETAHRLCFRKMKDLEEQVQKGLLSTDPAREEALVRVADIEGMLDEIKARCSAAHYDVSGLRDIIEQGSAK